MPSPTKEEVRSWGPIFKQPGCLLYQLTLQAATTAVGCRDKSLLAHGTAPGKEVQPAPSQARAWDPGELRPVWSEASPQRALSRSPEEEALSHRLPLGLQCKEGPTAGAEVLDAQGQPSQGLPSGPSCFPLSPHCAPRLWQSGHSRWGYFQIQVVANSSTLQKRSRGNNPDSPPPMTLTPSPPLAR